MNAIRVIQGTQVADKSILMMHGFVTLRKTRISLVVWTVHSTAIGIHSHGIAYS